MEDPTDATMLIARFVRDAIEDFHCAYLTDEQMAELNPLVRKGILEGLLLLAALDSANDTVRDAARTIAQTFKRPPDYWERPDADELDPNVRALGSL